jgi:hypothetical protein
MLIYCLYNDKTRANKLLIDLKLFLKNQIFIFFMNLFYKLKKICKTRKKNNLFLLLSYYVKLSDFR